MKTPKQKTKYRRGGFVLPVALLLCAITGCLALCGSYTHAWFVTERGAEGNEVETATYAVTVSVCDEMGNVVETDALWTDELGRQVYLCPLAPEDLHFFILTANGTAYSGHCAVAVAAPGQNEMSCTLGLAPDQSGMVTLQAAAGSVLTFSFDWGEGENPVGSTSFFGREDALSFYIEYIESPRTPHLIYEVAYGASLAGIADYYGVSVEDLCAYNGLDTDHTGTLPQELAIPYPGLAEEDIPKKDPYVPKGDLLLALDSVGAETPEGAYLVVTGPDGTEPMYERFAQDTCALRLPAGTYELTVMGADLALYDLETTGDLSVEISENGTTIGVIRNNYTRHVGDLVVWTEVEGCDIPDDAVVTLHGPEDTYEIPYYMFSQDTFWQAGLPTGEYTVELVGAEVENYDLYADDVTVTVQKDMTAYAQMSVVYERQVGDLEILLTAEGCEIPEDAFVVLVGPEDADQIDPIPYEEFYRGEFRMEDLPTGVYEVKLVGAEVENYTLNMEETAVVVRTDRTAYVKLFAKYERQVGDLMLRVTEIGHVIPDDAILFFDRPGKDEDYEISYAKLKRNNYYVADLPTGEYVISLIDAEVDGYTLTAEELDAYVEWDECAYANLSVEYVRKTGDLFLTVEVSGDASLPEGARLEITGPDGYSESVACESGTLNDLPTGVYRIYVEGAAVEGCDVVVENASAEVTETGGIARVSITYTAIAAEPETDDSGEEPSGGDTVTSEQVTEPV